MKYQAGLGTKSKTKVTGKSLTITGDGLIDKAHVQIFDDALGVVGNHKVELYQDDSTDTELCSRTFDAAFLMDADCDTFRATARRRRKLPSRTTRRGPGRPRPDRVEFPR